MAILFSRRQVVTLLPFSPRFFPDSSGAVDVNRYYNLGMGAVQLRTTNLILNPLTREGRCDES